MSKLKKQYVKKINEMVWSFSRLQSWHNCKLGWKNSYLDEYDGVSNGWAKAGSLGHDIFEKFFKGEIDSSELLTQWLDRYDKEVDVPFPQFFNVDLFNNYKTKVAKYFSEFKGIEGNVMAVEEEFTYELPDGNKFRGFIDLITENNGKLFTVDHKISKKFSKKLLDKKSIQIYLYAPAIKQKYEKYPSIGVFHFFQNGGIHAFEIKEEGIESALLWATETIKEIKEATSFPPITEFLTTDKEIKDNKMYCTSLCNHRQTCEAGKLMYDC